MSASVNSAKPELINGQIAIDDRGDVAFANDFSFVEAGIKRFYLVANHQAGFVRAWHAHQHEAKYVLALSGVAQVGVVKIDNWDNPSKNLVPEKFVLSAKKMQILYIPAGYANGFMSLSEDLRLCFYSTSSLEQSKDDDFRYPAEYWNIWNIPWR